MRLSRLTFISFFAFILSCGGNDSNDTANDKAENCLSRCSQKAETCKAQGAIGQKACSMLCDKSPTETNLGCVEKKTCNELTQAEIDGTTVCSLGFANAWIHTEMMDCLKRCVKKAKDCSSPSDAALTACSDVCGTSFSTNQLTCLEAKPCIDLIQTFMAKKSIAELCPNS